MPPCRQIETSKITLLVKNGYFMAPVFISPKSASRLWRKLRLQWWPLARHCAYRPSARARTMKATFVKPERSGLCAVLVHTSPPSTRHCSKSSRRLFSLFTKRSTSAPSVRSRMCTASSARLARSGSLTPTWPRRSHIPDVYEEFANPLEPSSVWITSSNYGSGQCGPCKWESRLLRSTAMCYPLLLFHHRFYFWPDCTMTGNWLRIVKRSPRHDFLHLLYPLWRISIIYPIPTSDHLHAMRWSRPV